MVRVGFAGTDDEREQLGLVSQELLDEEDLAAQCEVALQHEMRAYVYGSTEPATVIASVDEE